jgi:uncharacterized protein Yka (UPF0111/DUF47 family)
VFERDAAHDECYSQIKQLEGRILAFALAMQSQPFEPAVSARLSRISASIRNAVHAAKSIRDTHHDLQQFRESANDHFNEYYQRFRSFAREFYDAYDELRQANTSVRTAELLRDLEERNNKLHRDMHASIYREVTRGQLSETEISTLLNVNREIMVSGQNLIEALSDALQDAPDASLTAATMPTV